MAEKLVKLRQVESIADNSMKETEGRRGIIA
jgi:hypothetical protein